MKISALFILFAFLGACRSAPDQPNYRPLPDSVAKRTKSIETVLTIPQKTLNADIVRAETNESTTTALVGPLGTGIFKLIDLGINRSRSKTAKEATAPVVAALSRFDVKEVMRAAVQKELQGIPWAGEGPVTVNASDDDEVLERLYARSRHAGFLSLACEYKLSPSLDALIVEVAAQLIPKSLALRKIQVDLYEDSTHIDDRKGDKVQPENALYAQKIVFRYPAPTRLADLDANAAQWVRNDGELIQKALRDGASAAAMVIARSLNAPRALTAEKAEIFVPQEAYSLDIDGTAYGVGQQKSGPGLGTTYVFPKSALAQRTADAGVAPAVPEPVR